MIPSVWFAIIMGILLVIGGILGLTITPDVVYHSIYPYAIVGIVLGALGLIMGLIDKRRIG